MTVGRAPDVSTLFDATFFAFDIETTGLDPAADRIVQLGGVYLSSGARLGPWLSSLIDPGVPIPPGATRIHGITDADVAGAETFAAVAPRFVDCLLQSPDRETPVLCGYNAPAFDVPFLNVELERAGLDHRIDPEQVLDPLVFARWHHRDWRGRTLEATARRLGIGLERAHSAAEDAEATANVLWRMLDAGLIPPRIDDAFAEQRRLAALLDVEWSRFGFALYLDRADGRLRLGFSAHAGELLYDVDRDYLRWCLAEMDDLTAEARSLIEDAAGG